MDHSTNLAQRQADAIKQRRHFVADLRLIAELVEDGLPAPIGIYPESNGLRVQVSHEDVAHWLLTLDAPLPPWETIDGGERVEVAAERLGSPITLVAFRRTVAEACS